MYGYKPPAARRLAQLPQQLADGGLVARMKSADAGPAVFGSRGLSQLRDMIPKMQAMGYSQQADATPAADPRAAQLQAMIPQMEAMGFKQNPQYFANGGRVRPRGFVAGSGTGTSDSIPARLSNGEYVLPADTVKAVGVEALDSLRAATHTPVKHEQAKAAHGFFAGGTPGGLDEEKRPNSFGDAAAVARSPGVTQTPTGMPAPAQSGAGFMPGTRSVYNESGKAISDLASQGRYGAAAGETARAALSYVPAVADDVIGGALRAVGPGVMDAGRQFFGGSQPGTAAPPASPAAPVDQNLTDQRMAAGTQSTPMSATPAAQTLAEAAASTPAPTQTSPAIPATADNQMAPGVFRHGRGQYSDNAGGMGFAPGFTGQPTAQNDAAWQRLADRSQADSMARVSAQQPAGFTPTGMQAPTVRHSGNDWQSRNDLRNAMVSASSIMNDGGKWDKHGKGVVSPERAYAMGLAQTDATLRGAQPGVDVAAMRENAGIQREGMQQAGATTRTGMTEQGANARESGRNILARDEFNLRKEASGFQTRAAQQQEQLRNVLLDQKATPEQRAVAQRNLAALSGKTAADRMQTVALPDTTNEMGQVVRGGQALVRTLEDGSVQQVPIGRQGQAGAAPTPALANPASRPVGTISTVNGKTAAWDGQKWVPRG